MTRDASRQDEVAGLQILPRRIEDDGELGRGRMGSSDRRGLDGRDRKLLEDDVAACLNAIDDPGHDPDAQAASDRHPDIVQAVAVQVDPHVVTDEAGLHVRSGIVDLEPFTDLGVRQNIVVQLVRVAAEGIDPRSTFEHVGIEAANQSVIAVATGQMILAGSSRKEVVPVVASIQSA